MEKFIKPEKSQLHPVDYINLHFPFLDIFKGDKAAWEKSPTEISYPNPDDLQDDPNKPTYTLSASGSVNVMKANPHRLTPGTIISKFHLLTYIKFKGDFKAAESHVVFFIRKDEAPYVRVGTDWYKIVPKKNRWGGTDQSLKTWTKDTIVQDHTKNIFKILPTFDDFVIVPDNKTHVRAIDNCYNLYAPFPHNSCPSVVLETDIPHSINVIRHIFGEHFDLGLKYMKILYEHPQQMLPVIVLVSKTRGTGKTTFLDWIYMIFGENAILVNPKSLTSEFNGSYATKNILLFEEVLVEKAAGMETLKTLTTGKFISVRSLYTAAYTIPFFGKNIMCTNKVLDFMRIDTEETRFWIRYVNPVQGEKNTNIDKCLFNEIPKFLRYLEQLPEIDTTKDRLIFTADEIRTEHLDNVKEESRSGLYKELEILIKDFFDNSDMEEFYATAKDIKDKWFFRDSKISIAYIRKVLTQEMELTPHNPNKKADRYTPFDGDSLQGRVGIPFLFKRKDSVIMEKLLF